MTRSIGLLLVALVAFGSREAGAQFPTEPAAFAVLRVDSRSGTAVLVGSLSKATLVFGAARRNLETGHGEVNATMGARFVRPHMAFALGARIGATNDAAYAGVFLWPTFRRGPFVVTGVPVLRFALDGEHAVHLDVDPARAFVRIRGRWRFGIYYKRSQALGGVAEEWGGPTLQLAHSRWGVTLDAVRGISHARGAVALTVMHRLR